MAHDDEISKDRDTGKGNAERSDAGNDGLQGDIPARTEQLVVTVGNVWREARVSCPHRDILRAHRAGSLDEAQAGYLRFHIEEAECPYCQAILEDLERENRSATERDELEGIRERLLSSTMTLLDQRKAAKD